MRRAGCGCAATGCAVPLVCLLIIFGAVGILAGNWAALAAPKVPAAPPAVADIPVDYLVLYRDAAARFGLDWPVLAAVGRVETNHGRNRNGCDPNFAGARGPMQFLEPTFVHAAKLAGISDADICDPADAIPAAAAYLTSNGAPADWQRALFRYNPADWYPPLVLGWAERYGFGARVVWPVDGGRISQGFGPTSFTLEPAGCFEGKCYPHFHDGIDIAASIGTPVRAIAAGRVTIAGRMANGAVVVEIEHSRGVFSRYGHLEPGPAVRVGQSVSAGELVGSIGLTGNTTGPHLHFEIYASGEPVDPLLVLPPRRSKVHGP
ncbi:MAG TPA: M23 family metallopeptidase [Candidatus Limnocylindrales bacterium]|nr:M23 family metallopeptidase [Candidatus Limnocylindrales bacterium]